MNHATHHGEAESIYLYIHTTTIIFKAHPKDYNTSTVLIDLISNAYRKHVCEATLIQPCIGKL